MRWNYICTHFPRTSTAILNCCQCRSLDSFTDSIADSTNLGFLQARKISSVRCSPSPSTETQNHDPKFLGYIDNLRNVVDVKTLHISLIKNGYITDMKIGNYLLSIYVKFKHFRDAQKLFGEMPDSDVRTWTILISGFARNDSYETAIGLFRKMLFEGHCPNQFTLSSVFRCCSSSGLMSSGKAIHGWILKNNIALDVVLQNSILDFYVKKGEIDYAKRIFDMIADKNTVSWNIMIGCCIHSGDIDGALDLFTRLSSRDVASWNTIISGLIQHGCENAALELLYEMVKVRACFDLTTFSIALALVSSLKNLELGKQIHGHLVRVESYDSEFVVSALTNMYGKCGDIENASMVFRQMSKCVEIKRSFICSSDESASDNFSWSSIVSGYVQSGRWRDALNIFCNIVSEGIKVDKFTLTSILPACTHSGMLELGQQIHSLIQKSGYKLDLTLCSSLIDMYAKCGSLDSVSLMFNQANERNVVVWTSMISAFALHGQGKEAVKLFELMRSDGIPPNEVTFVGVLSACSHAGLLNEGRKYFNLMRGVYKIQPVTEHFTCMVDLLGRAGCLDEIKSFINENGISHLGSVWRAFLSACQIHKNVEMGNFVAERLRQLEPSDAEPYILLSNIYAASNRWEESARIRNTMQKKGIRKFPGQSWIQLNKQIHTFGMGDESHPQAAEIHSFLYKLISRLKEIGYSADIRPVMQDVEEEQREMFLYSHSEKHAVVYGIMNTTNDKPILVMKNLRVCTDCHNFLKFTSQLLGREIIVRDIRRFHHFKHGFCSCKDYW